MLFFLTPLLRNYCFFGVFFLTPLFGAFAPLCLPYILRRKTQGRRLIQSISFSKIMRQRGIKIPPLLCVVLRSHKGI